MIKRVYVLREKSTRAVRFLFNDPQKNAKIPDGYEKVDRSFCADVSRLAGTQVAVQNGAIYELTEAGFTRTPKICKEA